MSGLLDGIRVIDLTRLLPGPLCTMHLADQGADVIKVEDPKGGDYARQEMAMGVSMSHLFHAINRGKRSVILDLKTGEGRSALLTMLDQADVLVESFRPGVMDNLGLSHQTLRERFPSLVICAMTAYGQTGDMREKAGHDNNMAGFAGLVDQFPRVEGQAFGPNFPIADIAGGSLTALSAIAMALVQKERTGKGAILDISLLEGALSAAVMAFSTTQLHGRTPAPMQDILTGLLPCFNYYETADGGQVAVGALEAKFWAAFCMHVDRHDLIPKGLTLGPDGDATKAELRTLFKSKTLTEWTEILKDADCCVTPVLPMTEAIKQPLMVERGMVYESEDPVDGALTRLASPIVVDGERAQPSAAAPRHGEQTAEIFKEFGISPPSASGE